MDEWKHPAKRLIKENLEGGVGGVCACVCVLHWEGTGKMKDLTMLYAETDNIQ